jgi:hypothetical protein
VVLDLQEKEMPEEVVQVVLVVVLAVEVEAVLEPLVLMVSHIHHLILGGQEE